MNKKMVFIYMDSVPEDVDFEKLTDKQVYYLAKTSNPIDVMIFSSLEEYMHAFNRECTPNDATWWGRIIDFSEFEPNNMEANRESLLQETIAILAGDIYAFVYGKLGGTFETAQEIIHLAKKFEESRNWEVSDDDSDYILELEKFEDEIKESYR